MKKRFLSILAITIIIATSIKAQNIPKNGLVAWYPFSGNANDSSGNNYNGTVYGATLTTDRFGNHNNAFDFDGVSSYIETQYQGILGTQNRSVAFWAKTSKKSDVNEMVGLSWGDTNLIHIIHNSGKGTSFRCAFNLGFTGVTLDCNYLGITYDTPDSVADNKWHFYTYIVDTSLANGLRLYQDGKLLTKLLYNSDNNFPNGVRINTLAGQNLWFGRIATLLYYKGSLDDIRLYNRALDSVEIQSLLHERGYQLPVSILNLGSLKNGESIKIEWRTATELNTANFNIQQSTNGNSFINIGTVKAIGIAANSYSFTDNNPANGINFYRLQSVDKDGRCDYSNVISVNFNDKQSFSIIPNPAKDIATISFCKTVDKAIITVYDLTGKQVIKHSHSGSANNYKLNTQTLKSGLYVIKVNTATGSYNEKLLINK